MKILLVTLLALNIGYSKGKALLPPLSLEASSLEQLSSEYQDQVSVTRRSIQITSEQVLPEHETQNIDEESKSQANLETGSTTVENEPEKNSAQKSESNDGIYVSGKDDDDWLKKVQQYPYSGVSQYLAPDPKSIDNGMWLWKKVLEKHYGNEGQVRPKRFVESIKNAASSVKKSVSAHPGRVVAGIGAIGLITAAIAYGGASTSF